MKRSLTFLAILGLLIGFNACERQEWSKTREMHLSTHGKDGHHADGAAKDHDKAGKDH